MSKQDKNLPENTIEDRPLTEEELFLEEVLQAQEEALAAEAEKRKNGTIHTRKLHPIVKLAAFFIALTMLISSGAGLLQVYSIPAIEFIKVSAKLSQQDTIKSYKEAVVHITTGDSKGTGFAITSDGYIVTNSHVIEDKLAFTVSFPNEGMFKGEVIADYPEVDLAILKVDATNLPFLELAPSLQYELNEHIYFIGNPLYFSGIANEGTLLEKYQPKDLSTDVVMMDAPVYKGNSGSPVINGDGLVIGVVYATTQHKEHGKVGLFIPIDAIHERFQQ